MLDWLWTILGAFIFVPPKPVIECYLDDDGAAYCL